MSGPSEVLGKYSVARIEAEWVKDAGGMTSIQRCLDLRPWASRSLGLSEENCLTISDADFILERLFWELLEN